MSDSKNVIIDAAARFSARRDLAEFDTGLDETRLIMSTLRNAPDHFYDYLSICNSNLGDKFPELQNGLEVRLVNTLDVSPEPGVEIEHSPSENYGVFYTREFGESHPMPSLYVSTKGIQELHQTIEPIFTSRDFDEESFVKQKQLEAAVTMVAWMGLGRWAFERLDPRSHSDCAPLSDAHMTLAMVAKIDEQEYFDSGTPEEINHKISAAMTILEHRLTGAFAFTGLLNKITREAGTAQVTAKDVHLFHAMFSAMSRTHLLRGTRDISATEFALANPLSHNELQEILRVLNTVGPELLY